MYFIAAEVRQQKVGSLSKPGGAQSGETRGDLTQGWLSAVLSVEN